MPEANEDDPVDEWTTIQKPTRRHRPQRRPNRHHIGGAAAPKPQASGTKPGKDVSDFLEKPISAQLKIWEDDCFSVTPDKIVQTLDTCLQELGESQYWENLRRVLKTRAETNQYPQFRSIVCYGIGNFGTKRSSAPMWQLALALMIRDFIGTLTVANDATQSPSETNNRKDDNLAPKLAPTIHYYEPLMTVQESVALEKLGIQIIRENERGKRSVNDNEGATLFFMPHCPLSLYTNLFHTNWDSLFRVMVFGNSLSNYIDGGNTSIVTDPKKQQALKILETLQPFWEVDVLKMNKKDIADRSAYFEQAFNDSSFTSFVTDTSTAPWPERLQLDTPLDGDGGEVL